MASTRKSMKSSDPRWWDQKSSEAVGTMLASANNVRTVQQPRTSAYLHFARLYYGWELSGLGPDGFSDEPDPIDSEPISENVVRSCVLSALPRVCKSKPRAMFLTQAGRWADRVRAHRLEQVVAGDFKRAKTYLKWRTMIRDGAIFGTGAMRHFERNGRPESDRVLPWSLCVDPADGYEGEPRNLYYWKYFDKRVMAALFPKKEAEIMNTAPTWDSMNLVDGFSASQNIQDQILVWRAWHLPSVDGAKDGQYICGGGNDIEFEREDWKYDYFPFTIYHWDQPLLGFFGEGLARQVSGHQFELASINKAIRMSLRHAVPRTYVPFGSQIRPSDLDDRVGTIIEYTGQAVPTTLSPAPIHNTYLQWREAIKTAAFEETGVSQMSAYSQKPAGITAAKALQLYEDVEDTRFLSPAENAENAIVDIAQQYVRIRKEIADSSGENKALTTWEAKRRIWRKIDWDEVDLDADCYTTMVYPVSQLPSTPAGKTDLVESWAASGLISADERRQLLDFPDIEAYADLHNAAYDYTMQCLEDALMDGKAQSPDPTVGWEMPLSLGRLVYIAAKRDGCPEENLQLVRDFLDACVAMKTLEQGGGGPATNPQQSPGPAPGLPEQQAPVDQMPPQVGLPQ